MARRKDASSGTGSGPSGTHAQDIDRHVGSRLRQRRLGLGLKQRHIGDLIGVTYQQIHKYEAGLNRLSAGWLHEIARALDVDVSYFFAGLDERHARFEPTPQQRQMLELARDFGRLTNHTQRQVICDLACALANPGSAAAREPEDEAVARSERLAELAVAPGLPGPGAASAPG